MAVLVRDVVGVAGVGVDFGELSTSREKGWGGGGQNEHHTNLAQNTRTECYRESPDIHNTHMPRRGLCKPIIYNLQRIII